MKVQTSMETKAHSFLGTWNGFPEDWKLKLAATGATFVAAQQEKEATLHIQFYLWFRKTAKAKKEICKA